MCVIVSDEKAKSKSISMTLGLWDKLQAACEVQGEERSQYVQRLVIADLRSRGLYDGLEGLEDIISMIREAADLGVSVGEVFAREIALINEGTAA
tara:strand:- start:2012 stop:2296 length:285 start_codon:yes stop_codon:yes gene_type:complete